MTTESSRREVRQVLPPRPFLPVGLALIARRREGPSWHRACSSRARMIIPALSEALAAKAVPALVTKVELSAADFAPLFAAVEEGGRPVTAARPAARASATADALAGAAAAA